MSIAETYGGLRVLDVSTNLAGPFAAMMLGDMGADVIKIERTPNGDDTRLLPPFAHGQASVFLSVNRNKRSILLDLKSAQGRNAFLKLVRTADVVIESFAPGLAVKLGLTREEMVAVNPRLIVCSISAFGDGPLGGKMPGYDALVQAASGMMSFTGSAGSPTVRIAPSVLDLTTGMWAAMGIMAALARHEAAHIRACLLDSSFVLMCHQLLGHLATGELPQKLGSGAPSAAPYGVFAASDGELMIATASDPQFIRLCSALELEHVAGDARFKTMADRLKHRDALNAELATPIAQFSVDHWLTVLSAVGISVSRVHDLAEALSMPVTAERRALVDPASIGWSPGLSQVRLPIDSSASGLRRPPPLLGQHSEEILREAGCSEAEISALLSVGPTAA